MVTLAGEVVRRYEQFSLYNSPYPAHDRGCAVDLYPGHDEAASPVAGEVIETKTVRCPPKPYAVEEDHLILIDCGDRIARVLHVDPAVSAGDSVAVGDRLGRLVRSGFFSRWVDIHIHLGFREPGQNAYRATGSLPLSVDIAVDGLSWDGTGEIIETGPTHVRLDSPTHAGDGFSTLASDEGVPLDGGLPHYAGGGALLSAGENPSVADGELSLLGTPVGSLAGRDVAWNAVAPYIDGQRATGLSLFASRVQPGAKLVFHEGHEFSVGDAVEVGIEPVEDPIQLG